MINECFSLLPPQNLILIDIAHDRATTQTFVQKPLILAMPLSLQCSPNAPGTQCEQQDPTQPHQTPHADRERAQRSSQEGDLKRSLCFAFLEKMQGEPCSRHCKHQALMLHPTWRQLPFNCNSSVHLSPDTDQAGHRSFPHSAPTQVSSTAVSHLHAMCSQGTAQTPCFAMLLPNIVIYFFP